MTRALSRSSFLKRAVKRSVFYCFVLFFSLRDSESEVYLFIQSSKTNADKSMPSSHAFNQFSSLDEAQRVHRRSSVILRLTVAKSFPISLGSGCQICRYRLVFKIVQLLLFKGTFCLVDRLKLSDLLPWFCLFMQRITAMLIIKSFNQDSSSVQLVGI